MRASCKWDMLCEIKTALWFCTSCQAHAFPNTYWNWHLALFPVIPCFLYAFPSLSFFSAPSVGVWCVMWMREKNSRGCSGCPVPLLDPCTKKKPHTFYQPLCLWFNQITPPTCCHWYMGSTEGIQPTPPVCSTFACTEENLVRQDQPLTDYTWMTT